MRLRSGRGRHDRQGRGYHEPDKRYETKATTQRHGNLHRLAWGVFAEVPCRVPGTFPALKANTGGQRRVGKPETSSTGS
jgi:hypothetical protein